MLFQFVFKSVALLISAHGTMATDCQGFPPSLHEFSSGFQQPIPPIIHSEFNTSFLQHKWDQDVSHITSGFIQNSPSSLQVRVDETFEGTLASSIFNYANVSEQGQVENILTSTTSSNLENPTVFRGYVTPNFPLWAPDTLRANGGAVFTGLVNRDLISGKVASWSLLFQGVIPVTVFVDACNIVVGYDYFSPGLRTRVVTAYFNTAVSA